MKKIAVIIAAAGSGTRMQQEEKKQYIKLLGKEVLVRTLEMFQDNALVEEIVIVTNVDEMDRCYSLVNEYSITKVKKVTYGGDRRQDSIFNGLKELSDDVDIVMIHDAARPFVTDDIIFKNIEAVSDTGGVVTAVPTKDTIKVVEDDFVIETLDRSKLVNVQTPQTFDFKKILQGYRYMQEHKLEVTDDSSLAEAIGIKVKFVMGSYDNIKITTPDDLLMSELILKRGNR